jgi:hypothetical protein
LFQPSIGVASDSHQPLRINVHLRLSAVHFPLQCYRSGTRTFPLNLMRPLGRQGTRSASAADRIGRQASLCQSATRRIGAQPALSRISAQPLGRQSAFRPSRPGRLGLQAIDFRTATDVPGPQAATAGSAPDRLGAQSACFPPRSSSLGIHFGNFPPISGHFATVGTYLTEIRASCTIVVGSLISSG